LISDVRRVLINQFGSDAKREIGRLMPSGDPAGSKRFESGKDYFTQITLLYIHMIMHEMLPPPCT